MHLSELAAGSPEAIDKSLEELVDYVDDLIDNEDWEEIDELLSGVSDEIDLHFLIAVIRSTHRFKKHLPGWDFAFLMSREAARKQGEDPDKLCVGLV